MAAQEVILETNPAQPVPYSQKAVEKVLADRYLIADTKKDGVQLNLVVRRAGGSATYPGIQVHALSRAGKFLPALQDAYGHNVAALVQAFVDTLEDDQCIYPEGFMLQAEIVTPGEPAEVTAGNLRRKSKPLALGSIEIHVYGVVPMATVESGEDHPVTHSVMKYHVEAMVGLLQKHVPQINWAVMESLDVFTLEDLQELYEHRRSAGEEGLVLKDPNEIWKRGKKVGQWKMKPDDTIDGKVVGLIWGTPGLGNEGKVVGFEVLLEDGTVVNACGLTQSQKDIFTMDVGYGKSFMGWAVEVAYMERYKDGSLRHPTFSRWRGISDPTTKE